MRVSVVLDDCVITLSAADVSKTFKQYHPDKQGPDVSVTEAEEHLHRFIEVNQAWKVLSNKETNSKRGCDLQLRAGELNQGWPVDARVSLDDMTSDDDNEVYAYGCCCGGEFSIGREAEDEKAIGDPRVWETGPSIPSLSGSISIGHNIDRPSPQMTIRE
ncbi:dnaJ homolog subfamily C member 24-like [Oncorhynchus keta]|uniref:dnaJ homolog subfamily C member 24-like n=1 Tax=Oncorhynchus keta TaxID=8018 RepID=UPI00227CFB32|nr:dnaJ homolog subfamily C member 24-like [Oncorhynchus keta]